VNDIIQVATRLYTSVSDLVAKRKKNLQYKLNPRLSYVHKSHHASGPMQRATRPADVPLLEASSDSGCLGTASNTYRSCIVAGGTHQWTMIEQRAYDACISLNDSRDECLPLPPPFLAFWTKIPVVVAVAMLLMYLKEVMDGVGAKF